ncbi:MAG: methylenetetrahydrofolate--tRNA-(uracil(54)-C(5))-methyltransferase (FADH(2)-oxidizing) TrmFO [Anaerolineaceae bacterium]|nr:methylenetetrahydrofolate--tRNA-(uracil(54)-C(5))-methyltransferase (FADH(2)-oxidizing) TrmFO [Anaerolineaceae bacterium]
MQITVIGGGLSGSEAAWQAAQAGCNVKLFEMRPTVPSPAHETDYLGELICSNSLGSSLPERASGMLKEELRIMNSLLLQIAEETALPAGSALAVDRHAFAQRITQTLEAHPKIEIIRQESTTIPDGPAIICTGPLTSDTFSSALSEFTGSDHLFFFDAIAPIVNESNIDFSIAFRASRYDKGTNEEGDYINCPMNKEQYFSFVDELVKAEKIKLRSFESDIQSGVKAGAGHYFEGCLPVEVLATRGVDTLAYGPMTPKGLMHHTEQRPYAIVQLRRDNLAGSLYNLVGFQTNLKFPEQQRVFRLIPGLQNAEFYRFGQMHRNTFLYAPAILDASLQTKKRTNLFIAGQLTGVEGYMGNIATGLLAGINAARVMNQQAPFILPETTMLGSLVKYITQSTQKDFQPMKANFGIIPALPKRIRDKRKRFLAYTERGLSDLQSYLNQNK